MEPKVAPPPPTQAPPAAEPKPRGLRLKVRFRATRWVAVCLVWVNKDLGLRDSFKEKGFDLLNSMKETRLGSLRVDSSEKLLHELSLRIQRNSLLAQSMSGLARRWRDHNLERLPASEWQAHSGSR